MSDKGDCLTEAQLWSYLQGQMLAEERQASDRHLQACADCRRRHTGLESTRKYSPLAEEPPATQSYPGEAADPPTLAHRPFPDEDPTDAYDTARFLASKFLQPTETPGALGKLNEFDVFSILGHGGYGVVFEAHDSVLNRRVAVKVLTPDLAHQTVSRRRFIREARAAAAINHPNVVTIYGVDETGAQPFLVMEMLRGKSLRERLRREPKLDLLDILRIGVQISQGLAAAHSQGIVHRDVKPGNVLMVDDTPRVKLTDFGLARVATENIDFTSGVAAAGTPGYMSPEQVRGEELDTRSDLFALGCVIYAMFTGHSPFHGRTVIDIARRIDSTEPPRLREVDPAIPEFMDELVHRLLRKRPDDRFQSAAEVADTLNRHLALLNQTPTDRMPIAVQRQLMTSPPIANRATIAIGAVVLLLLLVAGGAFVAFSPERFPRTTATPDSRDDAASRTSSPPTSAVETNSAATLVVDDSPVPATTIRVSRGGKGDYRSLAEALAVVRPHGEIRVIDDATYDEPITLEDRELFEGVTIRATRGAKLRSTSDRPNISIHGVPGVELSGFFVETPQKRWSVEVRGECPDLKLHDLTLRRLSNPDGTDTSVAAIVLHDGAAGTAQAPISLRRIRVENTNVGLVIGATSEMQTASKQIRVEDCRIDGLHRETSTLIALLPGCEEVTLPRNVFFRGSMGVSLVSKGGRSCRDLVFDHNTWFDVVSWLTWTGTPPAHDTNLRFHDNLVVDAKRVATEMRDLALADVSIFRGNLSVVSDGSMAERSTTDGSTPDALAPCALSVPNFPLQSLTPSDPNFLRPDFKKLAEKAAEIPAIPGAFTTPEP